MWLLQKEIIMDECRKQALCWDCIGLIECIVSTNRSQKQNYNFNIIAVFIIIINVFVINESNKHKFA